jgi:hypothetical protein
MPSRLPRVACSAAPLMSICCLVGSLWLQAQVPEGMVNPDIDVPGEPFSYFTHPTDEIGALYAPVGSEVTPEGYVWTGFGEFMFLVGNPPQPINVRIKTLYKGYLPIVQYQLHREGLQYNFTAFADDLGRDLAGLPVNFLKVEIHNESKEQRTAFLSSAYRFAPPQNGLHVVADYRSYQRIDLVPKEYSQGQTTFDPKWKYSFDANALVRDGRIVYMFPSDPKPLQVSLSLFDKGFQMWRFLTGEIEGNPDPKYTLDAHSMMGMVTYRIPLRPGQTQALAFKMPIVPLPVDSPAARLVKEAEYTDHFARTVAFWRELVGNSSPLRFPELKVQNYLLANTIYDLLGIDKVGEDYIPNVGKIQYHAYYGGANTANMTVAFDDMGLAEIARKTLIY